MHVERRPCDGTVRNMARVQGCMWGCAIERVFQLRMRLGYVTGRDKGEQGGE